MGLNSYKTLLTESSTNKLNDIIKNILNILSKIKNVIKDIKVAKYVKAFFGMIDYFLTPFTYGVKSELIYKENPKLYLYAGVLTLLMISPYKFLSKRLDESYIVNIIRKVTNGRIIIFDVKKSVIFNSLSIVTKKFIKIENSYRIKGSEEILDNMNSLINNIKNFVLKKKNKSLLFEDEINKRSFDIDTILCIYTVFYTNLTLILALQTGHEEYIGSLIIVLVAIGVLSL
ncbi:MAG: hypothetical protein ACP5G1_03870 [Nanopusillaceae archaeon]